MKIVLVILVFIFPSSIFSQEYYKSNSLGFPLEQIGWYRQSETEWILRKDPGRSELNDILTLSRWGKPIEIINRNFFSRGKLKSQLIIKDGQPNSNSFFDLNGNLVQETIFKQGRPEFYIIYNYSDSKLRQTIWLNFNKIELFRDILSRDIKGKLRRLERRFPDGKIQGTQWIYGSERLNSEWNISGVDVTRYFLSLEGRDLKYQLWESGKLLEQKVWDYNGSNLATLTQNDFQKNEEKISYFNNQKQVIKTIQGKSGDFTLEETFSYNEKNQMVERFQYQKMIKDQYQYSWDSSNRLETEKFFRNGELQTIRYFKNGEMESQDVFWSGSKILTIKYNMGEKIAEQFFNSRGDLIRERVLQGEIK